MSKSYSIFEVDQFPEIPLGQERKAPFQTTIGYPEDEIQGPPVTSVTRVSHWDRLGVEVLRISHEKVQSQAGRVFGRSFESFVQRSSFPAYYFRERKVMLLQEKKDMARSAMAKIFRMEGVSGYDKILVLDSIEPYIDNLKGAWFRLADGTDVTSQALFGNSIDNDARFEIAKSEGELNHVRFNFTFGHELVHVGISSDCTVTVLTGNFDPETELEMVMEIKSTIIDKAKVKR